MTKEERRKEVEQWCLENNYKLIALGTEEALIENSEGEQTMFPFWAMW